jgi:hypothetical protein
VTRDYTHYLVNLVNADPDYVVDVLGLSSWELVKAFPKQVQAHLQDEYNVRPDNAGREEEENGEEETYEQAFTNDTEEED